KNNIKIGVIGCGGRAKDVVSKLLNAWQEIEISSVYDPDKSRASALLSACKSENKNIMADYKDVINDRELKWIMVFSPNCYHKEHIIASFRAGKHVFAEKPLATSIPDCKAIYDAHKKSSSIFATGFVLRYAPIYRKAKEILKSGILGKIISIAASENITPSHGAYIMKNWRRFAKFAGPHILEKCCHDLDLLNWYTESLPSRVSSFGGLDLFKKENLGILKKLNDNGKKAFEGWFDPAGEKCPFSSEKDIVDHQCVSMIFRNGISANFQATLSNAIPERRIYFSCSEGTMITELYSQSLKFARIGEKIEEISFKGDLHGGGDAILAKELGEAMINEKELPSGGEEGLRSSVVALAIDKARLESKVINLETIWKKLGQ
ncbi:MAG TPA: Gfo/Idh/MocA family oxidoreductase, partial [Victivallales bacterium]|nr:Gfo/Idh/MocA family oxidoreductase [Victivallales bacterium]